MICPQCHLFTPDQGFKCMNCGSILKKKETFSGQDHPTPLRRDDRSFFKPWMLIPLVLLAILAYLFLAQKNKSHAINAFNPGAEFDVEPYLQKGKITVVDFYSDYCPPCRQISPLLTKLDKQRQDLVVLAVDINRKEVKGIDFYSPLARQYNLQFVPYFRIYNADGKLTAEGQEAGPEILRMLADAGISL
jgi:thiol-disulfide isomerase/thioredoxin